MDKSRANQVQKSSAHQAPTRLVLIDGNAILHRAYHALPPLTSPDGKLVNAVYGFTSILLRLIHDLQPTHIAVAFDRKAPTFRKKIFKEYQAKRPKMDEDLIPQIESIHEVVRTFEIPVFEKDGYEADDVIGTITKSNINPPTGGQKSKINQIIIVTGDKDLLQLVEGETVLVYMPIKGLSEGKLFGEKETEEKLGVKPSLIPDYKALAGDASDNYPGIPGIGPKTAVEILKKTGSIDRLYAALGKRSSGLPDNLVQKLKEGRESALLSHQLATIKTDVPIETNVQEFSEEQLQSKKVIDAFRELGFQSLIKRLEKGGEENRKKDNKTVRQKEEAKADPDQMGLF